MNLIEGFSSMSKPGLNFGNSPSARALPLRGRFFFCAFASQRAFPEFPRLRRKTRNAGKIAKKPSGAAAVSEKQSVLQVVGGPSARWLGRTSKPHHRRGTHDGIANAEHGAGRAGIDAEGISRALFARR